MNVKLFTHVVANVVLLAMVAVVAVVGLVGDSASVFSSQNNSPIYRGSSKNAVSLMINVYWGTEYIADMLAIFSKYNVVATFFVGGSWVAQYPDVLKQIVACGHEIGNHGYHHKQHSKLNYQQNVQEIVACQKMVEQHCGASTRLFAPPSGDFSSATLQAAADSGHKTIMWSRDTIDWRDKDSRLVFERATKDAKGGELVLMHPTQHTSLALEKILKYYQSVGLDVVPVSKNLGELWTSSNNTKVD